MGPGNPEIPEEAGHDTWSPQPSQPSHAEADTATTQQREVLLDHDEAAWLMAPELSQLMYRPWAPWIHIFFPSLCVYYIELLYNVHDSLYLDSSYLDSLSDIRFIWIFSTL